MEWFPINHIPRALNVQEDELSKDVVELDEGVFIVHEFYDDQLLEEMNFLL
jgi:hypothetical protein